MLPDPATGRRIRIWAAISRTTSAPMCPTQSMSTCDHRRRAFALERGPRSSSNRPFLEQPVTRTAREVRDRDSLGRTSSRPRQHDAFTNYLRSVEPEAAADLHDNAEFPRSRKRRSSNGSLKTRRARTLRRIARIWCCSRTRRPALLNNTPDSCSARVSGHLSLPRRCDHRHHRRGQWPSKAGAQQAEVVIMQAMLESRFSRGRGGEFRTTTNADQP